MAIQRYSLETDAATNACGCALDLNPKGDYVTHADHAAIVERLVGALENLCKSEGWSDGVWAEARAVLAEVRK